MQDMQLNGTMAELLGLARGLLLDRPAGSLHAEPTELTPTDSVVESVSRHDLMRYIYVFFRIKGSRSAGQMVRLLSSGGKASKQSPFVQTGVNVLPAA